MKQRLDFTDLEGMLRSERYTNFAGDTLYNIQYHILNPYKFRLSVDERIAYMNEGWFGVTHEEVINNWDDFLDTLKVEVEISHAMLINIQREIKDKLDWHIKHGTINQII